MKFGNLAGIGQAGIQELQEVSGISEAKAAEIKAAIEIGRRYQRPSLAGASLCSSTDVVEYYRPRLRDLKKEAFRCVLLDTKNKVIRDEAVSQGSLSASIVHPRETFKAAIRESAAAIPVGDHMLMFRQAGFREILFTGMTGFRTLPSTAEAHFRARRP